MAANPRELQDVPSTIVKIRTEDDQGFSKILFVTIRPDGHEAEQECVLTRGTDPNGDWSEELKPGELPKSIAGFLADFEVNDPAEIISQGKTAVIGIYFGPALCAFQRKR